MIHKQDVVCCLAFTLYLAGCQGSSAVTVTEILNSPTCETLRAGVTQVTFAELPRIRGVIMLQAPDDVATAADETPAPGLFAVSNGQQRTAGYRLTLLGAEQTADRIELSYEWQTPAPDSVQAQVLTAPCSVVELNNLDGITEIRAISGEQEIGRLALPVSAGQ